jgi:hypothetical protein
MSVTDLLFGAAALFTGYIISDAIGAARDERTVHRFTAELDEQVGFPATWRMRPPAV